MIGRFNLVVVLCIGDLPPDGCCSICELCVCPALSHLVNDGRVWEVLKCQAFRYLCCLVLERGLVACCLLLPPALDELAAAVDCC